MTIGLILLEHRKKHKESKKETETAEDTKIQNKEYNVISRHKELK